MFTAMGTYYWVETLWDRDGGILHQGRCGAANETTRVTLLALTGATIGGSTSLWGLAALITTLLGGPLLASTTVRKRRRNEANAS